MMNYRIAVSRLPSVKTGNKPAPFIADSANNKPWSDPLGEVISGNVCELDQSESCAG